MLNFTDAGDRTSPPETLSFLEKSKVLLTGVNVPRPQATRPASDLATDVETLTFTSEDEISLEAWYVNRGDERPLVILFHGYAAEKSSLIPAAQAFLSLGTSVMLVDFRGSGGSSASYTTLGVHEALDVAAAVRFARESLGHSRVVVFGQSMGSAAILRAIAHHGVEPGGIILESVFDSMRHTVRNRFHAMGLPAAGGAELLVFWGGRQWNFNGFSHKPMDDAKSVNCPALFLHGALDPRATLAEARRVYDAVSSPKVFSSFDDAGHVPLVQHAPERWRKKVSDLLAEVE
ncbi:MAG: alpha/beta fold hydrolase [Verrucomicrobia bacterium]|nr:alpha/beta fold hydrolase [Verrucomicrobiota bacterium]MCH8513270.1 alpha/beta fold hydrolase [Kiritimatiellia bacterium]